MSKISIPLDIYSEILSLIPHNRLEELCTTVPEFADACKTDDFWRLRVLKIGSPRTIRDGESWKDFYYRLRNDSNVYLLTQDYHRSDDILLVDKQTVGDTTYDKVTFPGIVARSVTCDTQGNTLIIDEGGRLLRYVGDIGDVENLSEQLGITEEVVFVEGNGDGYYIVTNDGVAMYYSQHEGGTFIDNNATKVFNFGPNNTDGGPTEVVLRTNGQLVHCDRQDYETVQMHNDIMLENVVSIVVDSDSPGYATLIAVQSDGSFTIIEEDESRRYRIPQENVVDLGFDGMVLICASGRAYEMETTFWDYVDGALELLPVENIVRGAVQEDGYPILLIKSNGDLVAVAPAHNEVTPLNETIARNVTCVSQNHNAYGSFIVYTTSS
jgi:hypothetical protein